MHQVRYGGCLAAHSHLRRAITPTPRQQGIETAASPVSSRWGWARLLKRVFALDLERSPRCQSGALRMIATITSRPVIRRLLRHLKLAADPPPLAPARLEQGRFAWVSASINALGPGFRVPSKAEVRPLGPMLVIVSRAESLRRVFKGRMGPPLNSPKVDQGPAPA